MSSIDLKKVWKSVVEPPQGWQGDLYFYNQPGQKIRYGFAPAQGNKRGTIVLAHGYGEHIDLYYETIKKYQGEGFEVWAMDWQGHGKSERDDPDHPLKPGSKGMMHHVDDLDFFIKNLVKSRHDPKTPLILNAHSMGGHIGLLYLKKFPDVFDGAVLSAPMFDIFRFGMGKWTRPFVRGIFNAACAFGLADKHVPTQESLLEKLGYAGKFLKNVFIRPTSFRGELRELMKELAPDAALGRPTFGWVRAVFQTIIPSMKEDFLKAVKTPVLIGSAGHEDLVDNAAHKLAAKFMPHARHVTIADAGHGIWFEDDAPYWEWWNHVTSFVNDLTPRQPQNQDGSPARSKIVIGAELAKALRQKPAETKGDAAPDTDIKPPGRPGDKDGPRPS